ncbi:uncharacterized protein LOC119069542 [Bradysia coprophila]|uniref:uncharacterized protein LOC119069542 n=1 Tax=Bradysia coprophila TaxID=38358 RepID=UPI00187DBC39|nr:uncharacterized protein LOC119069542 [Bradysia coprophila]
MGYDVHRFISELIDDQCICVICTSVMNNPMRSEKCEHTFCKNCIVQWLAINKTCPLDRSTMDFNDMKPAVDLNTILDQLEMKCDFESHGCSVPIKLHKFKDHVDQCKYNPNLMVVCDKGCGLQMTFNDYEKANCFTHLARLVAVQQKQIEFLMKTRQIWQKISGFKIRSSDPTMLRHVSGKQLSFAQSIQSLDRENYYFKVKILELGDTGKISIGLTDHKYTTGKHPGYEKNSIAYHGHDGMVYVNSGIGNRFGPVLRKDDIIECGVKFGPENDLVYETVKVYFTKNEQFIGERKITLFFGEMFATIAIESAGATVRLIE